MQVGESHRVIYAALLANILIAVSKFIAAVITGSSAMLSEGVHSIVDTGNQALLLLGIHRSKLPPDEVHPFGYGAEIFFWSFVVAILIFAIGAGISFYEGFHKLLNPRPIQHPYVNYVVLAAAFAFEGISWLFAYRRFREMQNGHMPFRVFRALRQSKDPTLFTILFEDSAALLGLAAATLGVLVSHIWDAEWADASASLLIAAILAGTAILLAHEIKGLLIGEAASKEMVDGIQQILLDDSSIVSIHELRTMHLAPHEVLLATGVDFADELSSQGVAESVSRLEQNIRDSYPQVTRIFIEAQGKASFRQGELLRNQVG